MITIDGQNIETTWTLAPVYEGFFSVLMKDAGIKERLKGDYSDTDGVIVQTSTAYTKGQEVTLSFFCDTFAKYNQFMAYLVTQKVVNLFVTELNETIKLEYMATTDFNDYRSYIKFSIKCREANPTDR